MIYHSKKAIKSTPRIILLIVVCQMIFGRSHSFLSRISEGIQRLRSLTGRTLETVTNSTVACSSGCLKCVRSSESSAVCDICDLNQGFFLQNGKCVEKKIANCTKYESYGRCAVCAKDYYLSNSKYCFKIRGTVEGCLDYKTHNKCRFCESGKYSPTGLKCEPVPSVVGGCKTYKTDGRCHSCLDSFVLNMLDNKCVQIENAANCRLYSSPFKCSKCLPQFVRLPNLYLKKITEYYTPVSAAISKAVSGVHEKSYNLPICQWRYQIKGCKEYSDHGNCTKCVFGNYLIVDTDNYSLGKEYDSYVKIDLTANKLPSPETSFEYISFYNTTFQRYKQFLANKLEGVKCVAAPKTRQNPPLSIANCLTAEVNVCKLCYNNYYLDSQGKCQKHAKRLENCFIMSQKFNDSCLVCQPKFYLKSSTLNVNQNNCEARSNYSIINCLEYSLKSDGCNVCKSPLILHNNGLSCTKKIDYCQKHNLTSSELTCTTCTSGYTYNSGNKKCEIKDEKCANRSSDGACQICIEGYYLTVNLTCIQGSKFETIPLSCKKAEIVEIAAPDTSKINKISCLDCNSGFYKFFRANRCLLGVSGKTQKCLRYNSSNVCIKCKKQHFLNGAKACQSGSLTGCVDYKSETVCQACDDRYLLVSGKCYILDNVEILPGIKSDEIKCLKWVIDKNTVKCDICLPNHAVKREQDTFITTKCIKDTDASPSIGNCKVLDESVQENNSGTAKCLECGAGHYKNVGDIPIGLGTSCSSTCPGGQMTDSSDNTCRIKIIDFPISNCADGDGRSLCFKCADNHKPKFNMNFFTNSILVWNSDYHTTSGLEIQEEKLVPFIEECVSNSNNELNYFFQIYDNDFEFRLNKTITTINGVTQYINVKNCDTSGNVVHFVEGDLDYMLSCKKCTFDAFNKTMLTVVPIDLVLADVPLLKTEFLEFDGQTPNLATSKMPFLSCHTQLILNEAKTATLEELRHCYVQLYDPFHEKFICRVCLPGYKAIFNGSNEISSCQKIQNCKTAVTPGICDKCDDKHVYTSIHPKNQNMEFSGMTRNSQIDRTRCIFLGDASDLTLAVDSNNDLKPIACVSKARFDQKSNSCLAVVSDNADVTQQCKGYSNDSCLECKTGYWMKFTQKKIQKCSAIQDFALRNSGCAIFENVYENIDDSFSGTIKCYKCIEGFLLKSGTSSCADVRNVYNCKVYNINEAANPKCTTCSDGYTVNGSGLCIKNTSLRAEDRILACLVLKDDQNCAICQSGYTLVSQFDFILKKQTTTCQQIEIPEYCVAIDEAAIKDDLKIVCTQCKEGYGLDFHDVSETPAVCRKNQGLANCKVKEGLTCNQCELLYFLNNEKVCQKRASISESCLEYHLNQDQCKTFFSNKNEVDLNSDIQSILDQLFVGLENAKLIDFVKDLPAASDFAPEENPENLVTYSGVDFCIEYFNSSRCKLCKTKFYLDVLKNKCVSISKSIQNCEVYASTDTCHQCEKDYLLINNNCVLNQNFGCEENSNQTQCKSCPDTYPILNAEKRCVKPEGISDCLEFAFDATKGAHVCSRCAEFFSLTNGKCELIQSQIDFCKFYGDEGKCLKCQNGYYFDKTSKICRIATKFEANCELFIDGAHCSVCDYGYYMDYLGQCQECQTNKEICDFCDVNDPSKCLVCRSGYYMNHTGACLK